MKRLIAFFCVITLAQPAFAQPASEKAEKRLAELMAADQARRQRLARLVRINSSNATESIFVGRVIGQD